MEATGQVGEAGAPELSDAELVASFRAGAEVALGELIRRHQIGIFRMLLGLLDSGDDAERACEKVFFDAARRMDELAEPARFYAWMLGLAREEAKKLELERKQTAPPAKPRPAPRDPKALVKQQVKDILGELTGDERLALILADLENDSFESIGEALGTTAADAAAIVENARTKFREGMQDRDDKLGSERKEAATLAAGDVLAGRYRIEALLGQGGMGAVYRAEDLESHETVAIKVLLSQAREDPAVRRRFQREAEVIRRVEHPHFVSYLGAGDALGEPEFVVMEYLDGKALSRVLEAERRLAPARALGLTRQILVGLGHAHRVGVVHRDVKPDNVLLVAKEEQADFVKILDLGIARLAGPEDAARTQLTQKGEVFGTPVYMAPEQVRGEVVDGRADLYALSVMLFEMLAAEPPFRSTTSMGLLAMHLATPPPRLSEIAPGIRTIAPLQALLDRGLAKEPDERFESADEFLKEVDKALRSGVDNEVSPVIAGARRAGHRQAAPERASAGLSRAATLRGPVRDPPRSSQVREFLRRHGRVVAVLLALALAGLALWLAWGYVAPVLRP